MKDAILELKEELKRYIHKIFCHNKLTSSDKVSSKYEDDPATPRENLLDEDECLKLSELNELEYTHEDDDKESSLIESDKQASGPLSTNRHPPEIMKPDKEKLSKFSPQEFMSNGFHNKLTSEEDITEV